MSKVNLESSFEKLVDLKSPRERETLSSGFQDGHNICLSYIRILKLNVCSAVAACCLFLQCAKTPIDMVLLDSGEIICVNFVFSFSIISHW